MTKPPRTVWITRTQPGAADSAARWQAAGCQTITAPLLQVSNPDQAPLAPKPSAVLIFTSPNGVFAYQSFGFSMDHAVITVGDKTAEVARAAGFTDVTSADGTSKDVTRLILESVPKSTPLVHCAGRHVRGRIVEDLSEAGYHVQRDLYYISAPVTALPSIDLHGITHIALYSPLAAKTLAALIPALDKKTIISISAATDAELGAIRATRLIARAPNEGAMLALLLPQTPR